MLHATRLRKDLEAALPSILWTRKNLHGQEDIATIRSVGSVGSVGRWRFSSVPKAPEDQNVKMGFTAMVKAITSLSTMLGVNMGKCWCIFQHHAELIWEKHVVVDMSSVQVAFGGLPGGLQFFGLQVWNFLAGGFKVFLFSISYIWCHPSHWRTHIFSRCLLHHRPVPHVLFFTWYSLVN